MVTRSTVCAHLIFVLQIQLKIKNDCFIEVLKNSHLIQIKKHYNLKMTF